MRRSLLLIAGFAVWVHPISAQKNEYADQCAKETNPDQAVLYCTNAIESGLLSDSDLAVAIRNRGIAFGRKGEYDRAIQDFDQAIRLNPNYAEAFNSRGAAHSFKGEYDRALQEFDQAIRLNPNYAEAFSNRGAAHSDKGEYDRAIEDYDQAIRLNPNYAKAFNNRGNAHGLKGEYDRAIQEFDQAIRLNPSDSETLYNRGNAYRDKGEYDRAIKDYDQAIRLNSKDPWGFFGRGVAHFEKGSFTAAVPDLASGAALAPLNEYRMIWLYLARARARQGPEEVLNAAQQFDLKIWPGPVVSLYLKTITPETFLDSAADPDIEKQRTQLCEAHFYLGEYELIHELQDQAKKHFEAAAAACTAKSIERHAARVELQRLPD